MRIIAGTARSLPLKSVEGMDMRPTTDRIKETLFNMIQNEVPGCRFLDLFAGSGQIGLEAVSRGAQSVVLVENDKKAVACIEENIRFTKSEKVAKLYANDVMRALRFMEGKYQFDLIFMDPPYRKEMGKFFSSWHHPLWWRRMRRSLWRLPAGRITITWKGPGCF